jgi:hypothetical protein
MNAWKRSRAAYTEWAFTNKIDGRAWGLPQAFYFVEKRRNQLPTKTIIFLNFLVDR